VTMIGKAMGRRVVLLPVPVALMQGAARVLGKQVLADRLLGSLQVDISATRAALGWTPPVDAQAAIDRTVVDFMASQLKRTL
jgi:nucleoside-diphosphate-sugar epimerase